MSAANTLLLPRLDQSRGRPRVSRPEKYFNDTACNVTKKKDREGEGAGEKDASRRIVYYFQKPAKNSLLVPDEYFIS